MRKFLSWVFIVFLLFGTIALGVNIRLVKANTITVPDDYPTIQSAINAANSGDTVFVKAGTYFENIVVNKTIALAGEDKETTTIDGGNLDNTILVSADDVVVSGFSVIDSSSPYPKSGIFLDNVQNSVVVDNNVSTNNGFGVFVMWGSNNTVLNNIVTYNAQTGIRVDGTTANALLAGNTIEFNQQDGVFLYYAYNVVVEDNVVSDNVKSGITPQGFSTNTTIRRNMIMNNGNYGSANTWYHGIFVAVSELTFINNNTFISNKGLGLYLNGANHTTVVGNTFTSDGMIVRDCYKNTVHDNTVNGKPMVYLEGVSSGTVSNAGQVVLVNCTNVQVRNLDLSDADVGVAMFLADKCTIEGNNIANGYAGMRLYNSSSNAIGGNNITNNSYHGVYASFSCNNNSVSRNTISMNDWFGIQWGTYCSDNVFFENNITMNAQNGINVHTFSSANYIYVNKIAMNGGTGLSIGTLSNNNTITGNNIFENTIDGISLYNSSFTTVSGNTIMKNGFGIELHAANRSKTFHNDFIDNINNQATPDSDSYNNTWDDGYPWGGNYWSDYGGTDLNGDGFGDTPYVIDASNSDNYPFIAQSGWKNTKLSFSLSPSPAYLGQTVTLFGNLTDRLDQPIGTAKLNVFVNGAFSGNLFTNSTGWFKTSAPVTTIGTYNVTIVYQGSATYNPSKQTQFLTVYPKMNTKVSFALSPNPAKVGQTVMMQGNLTDINNTIGNAPLEVYLKVGAGPWQYTATIYTNSSGGFSVSGKVTSTGTYQIAVLYRGSYKYNLSYHIETLTVNP